MDGVRRLNVGLWVCAGGIMAAAALGADSVSNSTCLPGDAVSPWDPAEQRNDYVVDLDPFQTSWGTEFGIAPIIKSSKSSSDFFDSLMSSQAISRIQLPVVMHGDYALWENAPGSGINPNQNNTPGSINVDDRNGMQFGVAFAEFATTDASKDYNGVIGGIVQYEFANPARLFVSREVAAVNGCDGSANVSQLGLGSINERGVLDFRADGFGGAAACGLTPLLGDNECSGSGSTCDDDTDCPSGQTCVGTDNIFRVDLAARNSAALNIISRDYPGGQFDTPSTDWLVRTSPVSYNTPGITPLTSRLMATNFNNEYVRGLSYGTLTSDASHLAAGTTDPRGNISYSPDNCSQLNSTSGMAAILAHDTGGLTTVMNVWGLDAAANPTGTLALTIPAVVTDPTTGATNLAGVNEFDNYHSQVGFRGGNGQIALGTDADGNLLVAATADHPVDGGSDWPVNYVLVARVDCGSGNVSWTMAGYNDGTTGAGGSGKPILDGPGGSVIGRMVTLDNVTGGSPFGPSISSPMIDAAGNVWFLSAVELFDGMGGSTFNSALLRAVYNPATFGYELELVLKLGSTFTGQNSGVNWLISFMGIADLNSIDSGAPWSQNISAVAHGGQDPRLLAPADPRTLGGLVIRAEIVYDVDGDGDYEQPCSAGVTEDQDYNVLLYIGSVEPVIDSAPTPHPARAPYGRRMNRMLAWDTGFGARALADPIAYRVELKDLTLGSCESNGGFCRLNRNECSDSGDPCTDDGDCPVGESCVNTDCGTCSGAGNACITVAIDCPPGQTCNPTGDTCLNDRPDAGGHSVGTAWWVGPECPSGSGQHLLVSEPFREEATSWPSPTLAGDCEIAPQSVYGIRAYNVNTTALSAELPVETTLFAPISASYWADVVGPLQSFCDADIHGTSCVNDGDCPSGHTCQLAWTLPDGSVNFDDVTACLWAWTTPPGKTIPPLQWVDLHGNACNLPSSQNFDPPNAVINSSDIQGIVFGFNGRPYTYYDPADCPATTWCDGIIGGTACSTPGDAACGGGTCEVVCCSP